MKYCHYIMLLSIVQICSSCILEEKRALLDFKASINETKYLHLVLPSWIDHHQQLQVGDCCNWEGVKCSNATGRIVELQLPFLDQHIHNLHYEYECKWFLNLSSFLPLKNLQVLNLSHNEFGKNGFDCEGMGSFKDLNHLNLDWNYFDNGILHCIKAISSLQRLSLSGNELKGLSPLKEICDIKNLVELHLWWNELSGNIPLCLSNLRSLKVLDISKNNFSGSIVTPLVIIMNLRNLEYLSLYGNYFEGSFPLRLLSNHSKLEVLELGPSRSALYVDFRGLALPPPFQLRALRLARCNLHNQTRMLLDFLFYQKELRILDLCSNDLFGKFPNWILENNTRIEVFKAANNSFTGSFLSGITTKMQNLRMLDVAYNEIKGEIPRDIGSFFPTLKYLNLSKNDFQGSIPESIGDLKEIHSIGLSNNNFSGEVPNQIGIGCVSLTYLYLSNNSLRGYFPSSLANLIHLRVLRLNDNHFSGSIPPVSFNSPYLQWLDMSSNGFQGDIPSWIGSLSWLQVLDLSHNRLEDNIPDDICRLRSLEFLNLSENSLNGSIPPCNSFSSLKFLHLQGNQITGLIPDTLIENSRDLRSIDFRRNRLAGAIPYSVRTLGQLRFLLLGGNNLQGEIPTYICHLKELKILDLSRNKFSGQIPSCLSNISFGVNFDPFDETWNTHKQSYGTEVHIYMNNTLFPQDMIDIMGSYGTQYFVIFQVLETVEFTSKSMDNAYTGNILNYMSGLDLSCNQLTGEIPSQLGDLSEIRAINLSHNHLQGSIPSSLSMLKFIESLDLSFNSLIGQVPNELANLNFLSIFNVSYNNLSGKTPETGQFANFDECNYRGNPNLCGLLFQRRCESGSNTKEYPLSSIGGEENNDGIDMVAFFWSFFSSFITVLATLAITLYLSPNYRATLSVLIDIWILIRFYHWYESRRHSR
ncbi:OLC1v1037507C2 [Oldenlandia corymbosa var. corymbosa]|uniref:OLC1v1037507C2 n=3 Tax=Oldenlandia corymbosa var. corymbosa TaxID=529605 RepID=A0AAV1E1Y6_OLDCO|nr:OLC1v1037507C2 [Oldenlandia corymbosa var. corymbosa]